MTSSFADALAEERCGKHAGRFSVASRSTYICAVLSSTMELSSWALLSRRAEQHSAASFSALKSCV